MSKTIDLPPFPRLTWDEYSWIGEITLPSWAGFQSRRGSYASVNDPEPSIGTVEVTVAADEPTPPTPEQAAAFRHLLENEAAIANAVGLALLAYYPEQRANFLHWLGVPESDEAPDISDVDGLRTLVGLGSVHVLSTAQDGLACIGFEFGCVWDEEHGVGVVTHRGRVLDIGHAETSFTEWEAEQGLENLPDEQ